MPRLLLIAVLLALAPARLGAQPVSGPYVAGSAGIDLRVPRTVTTDRPIAPPGQSATTNVPNSIGPAAVGSAGYGFGNGWRMEVEGSQRR